MNINNNIIILTRKNPGIVRFEIPNLSALSDSDTICIPIGKNGTEIFKNTKRLRIKVISDLNIKIFFELCINNTNLKVYPENAFFISLEKNIGEYDSIELGIENISNSKYASIQLVACN